MEIPVPWPLIVSSDSVPVASSLLLFTSARMSCKFDKGQQSHCSHEEKVNGNTGTLAIDSFI